LHGHGDPLIRAVSRFEHALLAVKGGSAASYEIVWDRHPDGAAQALETGAEVLAPEPNTLYRTHVARDLPGMMACVRETEEANSELRSEGATNLSEILWCPCSRYQRSMEVFK
jgi:hypothetical protein